MMWPAPPWSPEPQQVLAPTTVGSKVALQLMRGTMQAGSSQTVSSASTSTAVPAAQAKQAQAASKGATEQSKGKGKKAASANSDSTATAAAATASSSATDAGARQNCGGSEAKSATTSTAQSADKHVDVSRLDLRVGLITEAKKHPNADSLYVEQIDCGESAARTVVSGLVAHIPEPEMQQRKVVVVANLKPVNLKSIKSHAMVLAATGPDGKVRAQSHHDWPSVESRKRCVRMCAVRARLKCSLQLLHAMGLQCRLFGVHRHVSLKCAQRAAKCVRNCS